MKEIIEKLKRYTKNLKVLYVEDDEVIQNQTSDFLGRFFTTVDLAQNGRMGLEMFEKGEYDIVVSDINMPEMNGIEMCRKIREIYEEQAIVITSAYNESEYFIQLIDVGVDKFVMKPFDNKQFLKVLQSITKTVYIRKREAKMELELSAKAAEMRLILDMIDNAIAVFEEDAIVEANEQFLAITGLSSVQSAIDSSFQLPILMIERSGFLNATSNANLLEEMKKENMGKAWFKIGENERVYLMKLVQIPETSRCVLSMMDVSELESKLSQDELTKLPNKNFVFKTIDEKRQLAASFSIIPFLIGNIKNIVRWHGMGASLDMDKNIGNLLKVAIADCPESEKPIVGYMGRNKFLFIATNKYVAERALEMIENLKKASSYKESGAGHGNERIPLQPKHLILDFKDQSTSEIVKALAQSYDRLAM